MAAFELGRALMTIEGVYKHLGICAGGALDVQLEEVPNPPPEGPPPSPAGLRSV